MFHLTHIYVAEKILGNNPMTLIGSTLLDIPISSKGYLSWTDFTGPKKWHDKLKNSELKKGILSHVAIDYVSHGDLNNDETDGTGYAFKYFDSRFPKLRGRNIFMLNSHNLPEWLLELYVAKTNPQVFNQFEEALENTNLAEISEDLSQATGKSKEKINGILGEYVNLMRRMNKVTKGIKFLGNPWQEREKTLQECIDACACIA